MKNLKFPTLLLLVPVFITTSCKKDDDINTDDPVDSNTTLVTPISAFDYFNSDAVTVSFDGDEITIVSTALPNHTSPYWEETSDLYIDPILANSDRMSPGKINEASYTLTVPAAPEIATSTSGTGLGAIGIAVSGPPIYNDQEGPNESLSAGVASGFDYSGGHNGPISFHYHLEAYDVPENTVLSQDDENLVAILSDSFLIYGRKCNSTGGHPADLDESGGHTSKSKHSEELSFYNYHIVNEIYIDPYILIFGKEIKGTPNRIM